MENKVLGVLGGGQLGRMFALSAFNLGFKVAVLDPDKNSPAGLISHFHICKNYDDKNALAKFSQICDFITTEFENIPASSLEFLESNLPVFPRSNSVKIAQDRELEKQNFIKAKVPCTDFRIIQTKEDFENIDEELKKSKIFPAILKTSKFGYDGKGQTSVNNLEELNLAWKNLKKVKCILEKKQNLKAECSVIIARNLNGEMINFPVQKNTHKDGILAITEVYENNFPDKIKKQAIKLSYQIANNLNYVGVLCVEFFILKNDELLINEIAPRPHNSGHYSTDACNISQFETQVRVLTNLPLIQPKLIQPSIMVNLLGDIWFKNKSIKNLIEPNWSEVLKISGVHLHLYGKSEPKLGRKMGHLNIVASSIEKARLIYEKVINILKI